MSMILVEELWSYFFMLIKGIPQSVYKGMLSILCIGIVLLLAWNGKKSGHYIARFALIEYTILIYCSTVLFRTTRDIHNYDFYPFWSYNNHRLFVENIMNVVVFIPVGFLLSCASRRLKWWMVLLIGFGISLSIESMQFVMKRGFSEFDDVMHNTLGCAIGLTLISIPMFMIRKVKKQ